MSEDTRMKETRDS